MVGKLLVLCEAAVEEQLPACLGLPIRHMAAITLCRPAVHPDTPPLALQRGTTGFPLVDAGMRELWQTGYCCNYVRHIVAGFLIGGWKVGGCMHLHTMCLPATAPALRRRPPPCLPEDACLG